VKGRASALADAGREAGLPLNDVVQATGLKVRPQLPLQMLVMP